VTEVTGDKVSREQLQRMYTRYSFAHQHGSGKDVLELGCGSGQGLGLLSKSAKKVVGGDISASLLDMARQHYNGRVPLVRLDAQKLPFKDQSFDVVILFEAIYYLMDSVAFVKECKRMLRPEGKLLICNANKNLPDFNPSPHSVNYFSPPDFERLLEPFGFELECFGDSKVDENQFKNYLLTRIKKNAIRLRLIPDTMAGKKYLKRIFFGKLVNLPAELSQNYQNHSPRVIDPSRIDVNHKVIFAVARRI
jgi:ubiquinone/menaquinone biosynthesis C-methylase UbiE